MKHCRQRKTAALENACNSQGFLLLLTESTYFCPCLNTPSSLCLSVLTVPARQGCTGKYKHPELRHRIPQLSKGVSPLAFGVQTGLLPQGWLAVCNMDMGMGEKRLSCSLCSHQRGKAYFLSCKGKKPLLSLILLFIIYEVMCGCIFPPAAQGLSEAEAVRSALSFQFLLQLLHLHLPLPSTLLRPPVPKW